MAVFCFVSGICLIISNEFFYKDAEDPESRLMNSREGTKNDQGLSYFVYTIITILKTTNANVCMYVCTYVCMCGMDQLIFIM